MANRKGLLSAKEEAALREALKEGLRVLLLAVVPVAVAGAQAGSLDVRLIVSVGLVAVLRFVDSYLHQSGHAEKGLTRF